MQKQELLFRHLKAATNFQRSISETAKTYTLGESLPWQLSAMQKHSSKSYYHVYLKDHQKNYFVAEIVLNHAGKPVPSYSHLGNRLFLFMLTDGKDIDHSFLETINNENQHFKAWLKEIDVLTWTNIVQEFVYLNYVAPGPLHFEDKVYIVKSHQGMIERLLYGSLNSPFLADIEDITRQPVLGNALKHYGSETKQLIEDPYPLPPYWLNNNIPPAEPNKYTVCRHHGLHYPESPIEFLFATDAENKAMQIRQLVANQFIEDNIAIIDSYENNPFDYDIQGPSMTQPRGILIATKTDKMAKFYQKQLCTLTVRNKTKQIASYLNESVNGIKSELNWSNMAALMTSDKNQFRDGWWQHPLLNTGFRSYLEGGIGDRKKAKEAFETQLQHLKYRRDRYFHHTRAIFQFLNLLIRLEKDFQPAEQSTLDKLTESRMKVKDYILKEKLEIQQKIRVLEKERKILSGYRGGLLGRLFQPSITTEKLARIKNIEHQLETLNHMTLYIPKSPTIKQPGKIYHENCWIRSSSESPITLYEEQRKNLVDSYLAYCPVLAKLPLSNEIANLSKIKEAKAICMSFFHKIAGEYFADHLSFREAFVSHHRRKLLHPLSHFMAMIEGRVKTSDAETKRLWNTFFMCTPVLCLPLDLVPTYLSNVNANTFETAIIDNKEQTVPHQLVSILHRSNRAIVFTSTK
ncbi:MAG TPA: hypothetical protein VN040_05575 [Pseudosphingobacterium sp.]|nr:hypothetical protein [Pseudosphingobacterium sp.]